LEKSCIFAAKFKTKNSKPINKKNMKKQLLLMAMALFSLSSGYAQEEGGD
jgi:hypothetical protein